MPKLYFRPAVCNGRFQSIQFVSQKNQLKIDSVESQLLDSLKLITEVSLSYPLSQSQLPKTQILKSRVCIQEKLHFA